MLGLVLQFRGKDCNLGESGCLMRPSVGTHPEFVASSVRDPNLAFLLPPVALVPPSIETEGPRS